MLKKNDEIALNIDSCTALGSGVGKYKGMTVFAANTAPGDHVLLHIIKAKPNYAVGKVVKVIHPSKMRITPACNVFEKCGGCAFGHLNYKDELQIKYTQVKDNFNRLGGLDIIPQPIIPSVSENRYRNKAQFPVSTDKFGLAEIGFFAPHSHRVVDCADCLLQPEDFKKITDIFRNWIRIFKIPAYDERSRKGILRHIYLRKAVSTGEIMVCAVINGNSLPYSDELVFELTDAMPSIKSIILNINKKDTNVVLGDKCITLYGKDYITDILCGLKFNISPLSFYQVNHDTAEILYKKAAEYADLKGDETLLDLYCGTGTIGLTMANKAKSLIGVEIIPQAVENANRNAELNGVKNARFICADAAKAAEMLESEGVRPDVIVVDPPRKGCDESLIGTIAKMNPERIVYVSCDSATLARDCKRLKEYGYEVKEATPVDMFPRAPHCETVAVLSKIHN
ncbi:MAG: 23S rRNA (uracil(1939)-C(5))-methyltransferase RlmD [Clostridia bacterium]|nr:23S rRNA (uracil(1939)-C(5))-methyltransferase RlmD [Clostridia bacterium]